VISCRNTICDFLDDRNVGEKELNEDLRDQEKGGGEITGGQEGGNYCVMRNNEEYITKNKTIK